MSFLAIASPPTRHPLRFNSTASFSTPSSDNVLPSLLRHVAQSQSSRASTAHSRAIDLIRQLIDENAVLERQLGDDAVVKSPSRGHNPVAPALPLTATSNPHKGPSPFDRSQQQRRSSREAEWAKALQMRGPSDGQPPDSAPALLYAEFKAALAQNLELHERLHELVLHNSRGRDFTEPQPETDVQSLITNPLYPGQLFFPHLVTSSDDLVSLAVRFGTTPDLIRRYNRKVVFDHLDNVVGDEILIPVKNGAVPPKQPLTSEDEDSERMRIEAIAVRAFLSSAKDQCTKEEARFYLSEANFDVRTALATFAEDCAWAKGKPQRRSS